MSLFSNFYRGQKGEQKCLVNAGLTTFPAHSKGLSVCRSDGEIGLDGEVGAALYTCALPCFYTPVNEKRQEIGSIICILAGTELIFVL